MHHLPVTHTDEAVLIAVCLHITPGDYAFRGWIGGRSIVVRNIYHIIGHTSVCARLIMHVISVSVSIIIVLY